MRTFEPPPNPPEWADDFWLFEKHCKKRMMAGEAEYGDRSFSKDPQALLAEIQEELIDTANWAFILWRRIELMREALGD